MLFATVAGCTVGSDEPLRGDEASLALHDDKLGTELRTSPVHHAAKEFSRIGVMIDSDSANDIEIATSNDGTTWSAWQTIKVRHIEANARSAFNGEIVLAAPARHYKLRGTPAKASFLRLDTMDEERNTDWEDGESTPETAFAPAAFGNGYTYRSRAEWGAKAVNCAGSLSPNKITIHHTDTPANNPEARVRSIQEYHRNSRRWCDIGYHFLVDEAGIVYEGRSIRTIGAHAGGANTGNIGIAFIGSYNAKDPTAAQMASTAKLMAELAAKYNITLSRSTLKGHREVGTTSTDCPGARTFSKLAALVTAAKAVTKPGYTDTHISRNLGSSAWVSTGLSMRSTPTNPNTGDASLQGVIYRSGDSSERIPYATISVSNGRTTTADGNGYYTLTNMAAGTVTITASAPNFSTGSVSRTLIAGETEWGSVPLRP